MAKLNFVCTSSLHLLGNRLTSARPAPIRRYNSGDVLRSDLLVLQLLKLFRCPSLEGLEQCFFTRSTYSHDKSGGNLRSSSLVLTTLCHLSLNILAKSLFTSGTTSIRRHYSRDNLLLHSPSYPTPGSVYRSSIYQLIRRLSVARTPSVGCYNPTNRIFSYILLFQLLEANRQLYPPANRRARGDRFIPARST